MWGYLLCKLTQRKRAVHGTVSCTALGMPAIRGNFVCIQFSTENSHRKALCYADFVQGFCDSVHGRNVIIGFGIIQSYQWF